MLNSVGSAGQNGLKQNALFGLVIKHFPAGCN